MLGRRVLADAVAQVEDVRGAGGAGVGVRTAEAVEHAAGLLGHLIGRRKQHIGVDVALQRLAGTADLPPHHRAGFAEVHGPVQAQHLAVKFAHLLQPQAATLGEHDPGDACTGVLGLELGQHAARVGQ